METTAKLLRAIEKDLNSQNIRPFSSKPVWSNLEGVLTAQVPTQTIGQLPGEPLKTANLRLQRLLTGLTQAFVPMREYVMGLWLHGSLGTADYTNYSDVDALLILRNEVLEQPAIYQQVKTAVQIALRHVLQFDPLQHHGFFVGFERILPHWPADYLPLAALQYARPLWPPAAPVILYEQPATHPQAGFVALAKQVMKVAVPQTLYEAKLLLSQFMLLPAAYCQVTGRSVYKRESFNLVRRPFARWWQPMEEATRMRAEWKIPQRPFWPFLLSVLNPWLASRLYHRLERQLPSCYSYPDWQHFIKEMGRLAEEMVAASHQCSVISVQ